MLRCFYTAGTGMLVQKDRMDVLANNLTNVETTAYKSDSLNASSFKDMMIQRMNDSDASGASRTVGDLGTGSHINEVCTSFEQGGIEDTGRSLDFALEGDGFFVVSTPNGDRYTRDGSFSVSSDGYLITSEGYYVQGENGKISVGGDDFTVDEAGGISVGGKAVDSFRIVEFVDTTWLRKEGSNLFYEASGTSPQSAADTKVLQGTLEGSNVDIAEDLTRLLSITNAYRTNQRVLGMVDDSLKKTVNEVGKVG